MIWTVFKDNSKQNYITVEKENIGNEDVLYILYGMFWLLWNL